MSDDWPNTCVLCAARKPPRETRLKFGHVCAPCVDRIATDLRSIPTLAAWAAASIEPPTRTGASGSSHLGPRYPINLDAVDPALARVPGHDCPLVVLLEEWERLIREARHLAPYGPASAARTAQAAREGIVHDRDAVTLTGVVRFLLAELEWIASETDFPLEEFASEVAACARALRRWDPTTHRVGTMVPCPTLRDDDTEDGTPRSCGVRLVYEDLNDELTCPRCHATRSAMTLAAVALADGREIWLDPEAASSYLGVTEGTLRAWARAGKVRRDHGRYLVRERIGA